MMAILPYSPSLEPYIIIPVYFQQNNTVLYKLFYCDLFYFILGVSTEIKAVDNATFCNK